MDIRKTIQIAVANNLPCLLVGKHGTGKSYTVVQEALASKKKLHRVIITQETTPEDLVCQYELKDNETVMIKHVLLNAAENGEWICFEEINMGSPAVFTLLNGLIETDPDSRYIKFQDLEVKPHADFRIFATANPTIYSGANRMNDALLSRFLTQFVQPDYMSFLRIIDDKYGAPVQEECKKFLSAAKKVGKNYQIYISPREMLVFAQLIHSKVPKNDAVQLVLGRHYDLDLDVIEDIASLFEVEAKRDEIIVLNEIELRKRIDDGNTVLSNEIKRLKDELKAQQDYKSKYEAVAKALGL